MTTKEELWNQLYPGEQMIHPYAGAVEDFAGYPLPTVDILSRYPYNDGKLSINSNGNKYIVEFVNRKTQYFQLFYDMNWMPLKMFISFDGDIRQFDYHEYPDVIDTWETHVVNWLEMMDKMDDILKKLK